MTTMRLVWQGALASAFLGAASTGAMVETNSMTAAGLQPNADYPSLKPSISDLTFTFPVDDELSYQDSTLAYLPEGATTAGGGERVEASPQLTGEEAVQEEYKSQQRVGPVFPMQHVRGIKTLLVGTALLAFSLSGALCIPYRKSGADGDNKPKHFHDYPLEGAMATEENVLYLFGISTALLISGLVEVFRALRMISQGNLTGNRPPRLRGLPTLLVPIIIGNAFAQSLMSNPFLRNYIFGTAAAGLGILLATSIQLVDYKLKHANIPRSSFVPTVLAGATLSSIIVSKPQVQTNTAGCAATRERPPPPLINPRCLFVGRREAEEEVRSSAGEETVI
ncbi:hypothetical protein EBH_0083220 [Eimeria brunetti]|uniref:Uncharacterized protein n=1 Tax=Eimeria brunetti TaxID=51314 RepID=U6LY14_9EIME|nr:hypothetical protein EBH_0083220 [Eimeria brunetti]